MLIKGEKGWIKLLFVSKRVTLKKQFTIIYILLNV
jgi:hypothetical protein